MKLSWDKCRLIFCLFDRDSTQIIFYVQATVMASFFVTNMLIQSQLYPRWKVLLYIDASLFYNDEYASAWKQIRKCDVDIRPISLPNESCNKYWFTSLRFILPTLDKTLHAFRLLDVHYLWNRADVKNICDVIVSWETSNKRCQLWKYHCPNNSRPYCAAVFGLNLTKDSCGHQIFFDMGFLEFQLQQMFRSRITTDLSTIAYGDDEWMIYLLLMFYFKDSYGNLDISKVYLVRPLEHNYICTFKRYQSIAPEKWLRRYMQVTQYIQSTATPHLIQDSGLLDVLYK